MLHPILLDLGSISLFGAEIPLRITTWGVVTVTGVLVGLWSCHRYGKPRWPQIPWTDLYFGTIIVAVLGGKLANAIVFWDDLASGRRPLLGVLTSGGVWLGGLLAGTAFAVIAGLRYKVVLGDYVNFWCTFVPLAHGVGRLACLFGGCCYGRECHLPWAVTYTDPLYRANGTPLGVPLHPTPVYESLLQFVNFGICFTMFRRGAPPWSIAAAFLGLYGTERFFLEFVRADARGVWGFFTTSQWLSIPLVAFSVAVMVSLFRRRRAPGHPS